ncbi:hypothetical protein GCM10010339_49860 [Streptomyces alanosinicus]|uniref:Uncharacterized protein n=1 Tax=Streptomyces alanosinicus TaxID=68171 RepID=A0A918YKC1_9ACTN|nr:hypothetical protein GCM10010339_49860 [Streptomyces alanosinicus]
MHATSALTAVALRHPTARSTSSLTHASPCSSAYKPNLRMRILMMERSYTEAAHGPGGLRKPRGAGVLAVPRVAP